MKNRLTNYNFWISLVSAVLLIFQAFDLQFDIQYINEIVTAVLGLLVVIGIISDPTKSSSKKETDTNTTSKTNAENANNEEVSQIGNVDANKNSIENDNNAKVENNIEDEKTENEVKNDESNTTGITAETVPINEQTALSADSVSNNFEILIKQISTDLNKKMAELYKVQETLSKQAQSNINTNQSNGSNVLNQSNSIESVEDTTITNSNQNDEKDNVMINSAENNTSKIDNTEIQTATCHNIVN